MRNNSFLLKKNKFSEIINTIKDDFIFILLISALILPVFYVIATSTEYVINTENGNVISYRIENKTLVKSNVVYENKVSLLTYDIRRNNKIYTYSVEIPERCSDIYLEVKSVNPKKIYKYCVYDNRVGLIINYNSSKLLTEKYILK